jgi:hypothetical protein
MASAAGLHSSCIHLAQSADPLQRKSVEYVLTLRRTFPCTAEGQARFNLPIFTTCPGWAERPHWARFWLPASGTHRPGSAGLGFYQVGNLRPLTGGSKTYLSADPRAFTELAGSLRPETQR